MNERPLDDLEGIGIDRKLLIIAFEPDWSLTLEENPFPGFVLAGIADWLSMYAEATMQDELEESMEDLGDD